MKNVLCVFALFLFASCGMWQLDPESTRQVAETVVRAIDTNGDGIVTNDEVHDAPNDPMTWIVGILSLLGIISGGAAMNSARKNKPK